MQPHPRTRRTIKWGGALLTALLLVVWITSRWWFCYWSTRAWTVGVSVGVLTWNTADPSVFPKPSEFWSHGSTHSDPFQWWYYIEPAPKYTNRFFPLWPLALLTGAVTALAWWLDLLAKRRANKLNRCPRCRYDRSGLAAGAVCPECGAAAP